MLDASGSQWRCPTALAIQQWVTLLRSVILSSRRVRLEAFHTWAGFARDAAVPKLSELMKKKARETETSDMPVGPPPVGGQVSRFGDEFERVCSQAQSAGKLQDPPSQSTPFPTSCKRSKKFTDDCHDSTIYDLLQPLRT